MTSIQDASHAFILVKDAPLGERKSGNEKGDRNNANARAYIQTLVAHRLLGNNVNCYFIENMAVHLLATKHIQIDMEIWNM